MIRSFPRPPDLPVRGSVRSVITKNSGRLRPHYAEAKFTWKASDGFGAESERFKAGRAEGDIDRLRGLRIMRFPYPAVRYTRKDATQPSLGLSAIHDLQHQVARIVQMIITSGNDSLN